MTRPTVVTGGAGFIGSHLVEHLVVEGHQVRVIERPEAAVDHLPAGVEVCFADIRDEAAVRRAIAGAETVFHLAANPNLWARDRREFEAVNHRGTVHVLDAAIAAGAGRIVHCSTESILTCARPGAGVIAEDVVVEESDAVGPYCLSKLRAEKEAMARARAGHPVYVANPTMPIGPGDRGLSPPTRLLLDCATGRLPALLDCTLNIVDVRLAALGLARIPEAGRPGRRYLLGGENLTLVSFLGMVAERAGSTLPGWRVPYRVALAYAHLSEWWSDHVSGKPPQANVTGVRLTRRTMHFDSSRSLAELGLVAPPVRVAVDGALAWLAARGLLARSGPAVDPQRSPPSA
jgi:dihydroflavonol-4-reductase